VSTDRVTPVAAIAPIPNRLKSHIRRTAGRKWVDSSDEATCRGAAGQLGRRYQRLRRNRRRRRPALAGQGGTQSEGGAGGGGGSGFGPAGVAFETGVREGDGVLTITFEPDTGGCPGPAPAPVAAVVAQPRFTG
jgi:hypothetical protein